MNKRELTRLVKETNVRFLRMQFVDIFGITKNVVIPVAELEHALDGQVTFDGGSIAGFVRSEEVDMMLKPDLSTFTVYPWTLEGETEGRLICDIVQADGEPFEGCPRTTLKRSIADAREMGFTLSTCVEAEFYLFQRDDQGRPTVGASERGSYFDFSPADVGENARRHMVATLEAMGFHVASAHHEHGPGQHEIDFKSADMLTTADNVVTLRNVVRHIAMERDLHATFMPKPLGDGAGSALHIEFTLREGERNAFADESGDRGLSPTALFFIGGLLAHAPAITAIANPTVNSYKRLVPFWDAPVLTVWSERSANSMIRIPSGRGDATSIELRSPDSSCNPYLTLAVVLAAGLDGIRNESLPGQPFSGSSYDLSERQRSERGIRELPFSLREALVELDRDPVVRGALGDHIYHAFREAKAAEYERYRRAVHPWELDAYLTLH
ncbi:MAG TPA: type I glutamate--ammonia ligase [Candidatus Dormibacteraeota bacterium]|nr:type I glutamate--ammonia ligase [Candidatus Dormibacteraeota bacterium]